MARPGNLTRSKGGALVLGVLLIVGFALVVLFVGPDRDRLGPQPVAEVGDDAIGVDRDPDAAMAPLEAAEGAAGVVALPNAGAAVNPVTPTGELGGPAGQTPAWNEPGGSPTTVRP